MELEKYLTNNSLLIIPNNLKTKVIKYLNSLNILINTKIITINELKTKLLFDYDTKTIHYVMQKNNIDYNNALELINNMYYLFEETYNNKKIDNLNNLKKELINNNLLITDSYFINYLKNKDIFIYGFDYLNKFYNKIINELKKISNVTFIPKNNNNNYNHPIYNFKTLNESIEFIANDLINKDLKHIFIYGLNQDNKSTLKRIFNNYYLNINIPSNTTLFETNIGSNYLNNPNDLSYLDTIKDNNIKDLIISILNKYYWANDKRAIIDMLTYEFKHTLIPNNKYTYAVNIINSLSDNYFDDNDYIYIINFNNEYIPINYKDTDFINDNEKFSFLETTAEKNNLEKYKFNESIKNIKNLIITSANTGLKGPLKESSLINDYNYEIINIDYNPTIYSNKSNLYNLGLLLDNYQNFNDLNPHLNTLLSTYPNHNFLSYNNKYTPIKLKQDFTYNLSYSKLNSFFECPFKFFCDNILKIREYEETFDTYLGSLCHYILQNIYKDNFNFEKIKEEYLQNHSFNFTNENIFFLNKVLNELKIAIKYIKSLQNITKYQTIETEKNIETTINNINFIGIIDKIMHYNNNIVLIDYNTGTADINLNLAPFGLNLQLPTYLYLIKKIYPSSNIVGIYLQHILKPNFNKELDITEEDQYEKSLKLNGYTLSDESFIQDFDPTYESSNYISGLKLTSNGFASYSKVLNKKQFDILITIVENKINECITNINNCNFTIEPKIINNKNISCEFCPYKSICFTTDKDNQYLSTSDKLDFLEGDNNEMD